MRLLVCGFAAVLFAEDSVTRRDAPWISDALNRGLPSWLRFNGEERARVETIWGQGLQPTNDRYLLNRLRLGMDVRPFAWLLIRLQAQDSRVFGQHAIPAPPSQKDALDLRLGHLQIGGEDGAVRLRAGRQSLDFGEGRLVADPNWSNVGRTFDAACLSWQRGPVKLDLFTGAAVKVSAVDLDRGEAGRRFHGAYGTLRAIAPGMSMDPYLFWRTDKVAKNERGEAGKLTQRTLGLRWYGDLPFGFDYSAEVAWQNGSAAGDRVRAWMGHWLVGYAFAATPRRPRLFLEYNRASGDARTGDRRRETFDPLFPSAHDKYGLVDLFGSSNIVYLRPGFQSNLGARLKVAAAYGRLWLANPRDGLYVAGKMMARDASGWAGASVGQEADVQAFWSLSAVTQVNAGYGTLFPGGFLRRTTPGVSYRVAFLSVTRRF